TADGIHNDHYRSALLDGFVHVGGGAGLFDAVARQVLTHRLDHWLGIHFFGYLSFRLYGLKAKENGLRVQLDAKLFLNTTLYLILERDDVARPGAAAIDDGERMASRDAGRSCSVALLEAGLLNQPCGGQLHVALGRWVNGRKAVDLALLRDGKD